jgi:hypothetical protein
MKEATEDFKILAKEIKTKLSVGNFQERFYYHSRRLPRQNNGNIETGFKVKRVGG